MNFTQIELTSPTGRKQVWWIPVPAGKAKVGEKILLDFQEWDISAVCTTLEEEDIPIGSRIAMGFYREPNKPTSMYI